MILVATYCHSECIKLWRYAPPPLNIFMGSNGGYEEDEVM